MTYGERSEAFKGLMASVGWWTVLVFAGLAVLAMAVLVVGLIGWGLTMGHLWAVVTGVLLIPVTVLLAHLVPLAANRLDF